MKKTMLKLGVLALTLVMLLGCFAACGGGEEGGAAEGGDMKTMTFHGVTFKCPKNFDVLSNTGANLTIAGPLGSNQYIDASSSETSVSESYFNMYKEEMDEVAKEEGCVFDVDENTEIIDPYTIKFTEESDGVYYTIYQWYHFNVVTIPGGANQYYYGIDTITVMEPDPERSLAQKVFG